MSTRGADSESTNVDSLNIGALPGATAAGASRTFAVKRKLEIDTLRGLACVMLVAYHVVGYSAQSGLRLEAGLLRDINDLLIYFRMPLFTVLSGYVYALRPFSSGATSFIQGKARRLLLPMLTVGTVFAVMQSLVPGTNATVENWWLLHTVPYAHFWFVESLFLIFLVLVALESLQLLKTPRRVMAVFAVASLAYIEGVGNAYFSTEGAVYLFPYFLLGLAICRFELHQKVRKELGLLLFSALILYLAMLETSAASKLSPFALVMGSVSCLALLLARFRQPWLAEIGRYSFSIYLFHVFFTAGCRIALNKIGVQETSAHFIAALVLGLAGPIAAHFVLRRYRLTRTFCLGEKWR